MALAIFKFESAQVRTYGSASAPLFVAVDITAALGYKNSTTAIQDNVDPEDIVKQGIIDSMGRQQVVNCVTEAGMYALIFGSKLESAKRFKRWVTSEVLPAIRKTGQYQCPAAPQLAAQYLTVPHQYAIQSAVAKRVHKDDVRYQTVYQALKTRFQVPKYTFILDKDFEAAVEFIRTCELKVPEKVEDTGTESIPEQAEPKTYLVREAFLEQLRTFVYCWRYLFREDLTLVYNFLRVAKSPLAPRFVEAMTDFNLVGLEASLNKLGFPVKELDCYKHWAAKHSAQTLA